MKKSTYAVIGFLAFTIVASVGAVCLCVYHALAGDKIDRVERVEKEIDATGKLIEFGTENCREINFSGSQYGLNDLLAINLVFDADTKSPRIYMDELWAKDISREIDEDELNIDSDPEIASYNQTVRTVKGKDGREERVATITTGTLAPKADNYIYATVVLPADGGTVRGIDAHSYKIRVYGAIPDGFDINGGKVEYCGAYDFSNLNVR